MIDRHHSTSSDQDLPPVVATLLAEAVGLLRTEARARDHLQRLLSRLLRVVAPAIHMAGEPLDLSPGRIVLPGGSDALRVTACAPLDDPASARAAVSVLMGLAPLLVDVEHRTDTRLAVQAMRAEQGGLLGVTMVMRDLHERIARAARKNFIVLVQGESGAGKELVARQVHAMSARGDGPFVAINCAAIVESLLEAELFGIEERTATGVRGRRGRVEQADGGTLFLDEVSDLSSSAQAKLLRVIQDPAVERVGGQGSRRVDVRIVAATNRPLEALCRQGEFRWDLFYRLNAIEIDVPPLRARLDDIPYLVEAILQRSGDGQRYHLAPDAMEALMLHDWPGNVRELERVIERAITLASSHVLRIDDLPEAIAGRFRETFVPSSASDESLRAWGRRYVRSVLKRTNGNKREACRILDISYHTLQSYLGNRPRAAEPASARQTSRAPARPELGSQAGVRGYASPPAGGTTMVHEAPAPRLDT